MPIFNYLLKEFNKINDLKLDLKVLSSASHILGNRLEVTDVYAFGDTPN